MVRIRQEGHDVINIPGDLAFDTSPCTAAADS